ncbi:uncharacterized protein LOC115097583 [Rhinatrema bivittatum]|uniref:uncharacterized protein LOC115097583 n=1 Tax=Rhinatrema bivittatum TaxID=194408 RepID=UPI0011274F1F|nr:uncharacterized protein LOC115097583 [Rhinatrema bivittatum]
MAACQSYIATSLVKINSIEEKLWVTAMVQGVSWTGLNNRAKKWIWEEGEEADLSLDWAVGVDFAKNGCVGIGSSVKYNLIVSDCLERKGWVCERDEVQDMFQEYKGRALLNPVTYINAKFDTLSTAKEACLLEVKNCSGITLWAGKFVLVTGTTLITAAAGGVDAFLKTSCAPGFFGVKCSSACFECPDNMPCNPITGACDNLLTCMAGLQLDQCQKLVSLKCPPDPGWWFWNKHCYYIEETGLTKTWQEAKMFCSSYRETMLLTISSLKEKEWIISMINRMVWTGLNSRNRGITWMWSDGQLADTSVTWLIVKQAPGSTLNTICGSLKPTPEFLSGQDCVLKNGWICKNSANAFGQHSGMLLLNPVTKHNHTQGFPSFEAAEKSCFSHLKECTGVTFWNGFYFAVTGNILTKSIRGTDVAFPRSACSLGFHGRLCQERCKVCHKDLICNSLQGVCQGRETCISKSAKLLECIFGSKSNALLMFWILALISSLCPSKAWLLWKEHCYYIEPEKQATWLEAATFCANFRETDLLSIDGDEEKVE